MTPPDPKAVAEAADRVKRVMSGGDEIEVYDDAYPYRVYQHDLHTLAAAYVSGPPAAVREAAEKIIKGYREISRVMTPHADGDKMLAESTDKAVVMARYILALPGRKEVTGGE